MRDYRIALMDPTGNITLLVESPVPADEQPVVAARLAALFPGTEQTGFLYPGSRFGWPAASSAATPR